MRHRKHRHILGVKKEHRSALLANLASSLIKKGRIRTTTAKAKALRPFVERMITLAKKGDLHRRRIALSRLRDKEAVKTLFDERVSEFKERNGGYTRIYKLATPRLGDAADMAIIEFVSASDTGYKKSRGRAKSKAAPSQSEANAAAAAAAGEAAAAEQAEAAPAEGEEQKAE
ncbi:MAG: 50S ribosomal protein L17 [Verrucomicrobia bacterium]|nr:MAG: 50S ribosomal protein L17 [Verrucomicrobiota bacterium]